MSTKEYTLNTDQRLDQHQPVDHPLQGTVVHVALIEWGSDSIREPAIFLATSRYTVARAAMEDIVTSWIDCCGDDPGFLADYPVSAGWDESQVLSWLAELKEAMTVPWVTISTEPVSGSGWATAATSGEGESL